MKQTILTAVLCLIISAVTFAQSSKATTGKLNGHEWVDLGLPSGIKWATCNIGATKPEEHGYFFAWGETKPKKEFNEDNYRFYNGFEAKLTKYCSDTNSGNNGFVDNKEILEAADDAATANWGEGWRIPTMNDFFELFGKFSSYTMTENGFLFTFPNGNSIFFPYFCEIRGGDFFEYKDNIGFWLNMVWEPYYAWFAYLPDCEASFRHYGLPIRPVCDK